jgi:flagellar basal-body rod protein FlgB
MKLFSPSIHSLERALNVATSKQRVISSNIANVDTPNYKGKEVSFQAEFQKALGQNPVLSTYRTHEKHIPFSTQKHNVPQHEKVVTRPGTLFNHNGNNVDMDYEMAQMAKNQLWYSALTERMNGQFSSLRTVINDGR